MGIEPRTYCFTSQEPYHYTTAAPIVCDKNIARKGPWWQIYMTNLCINEMVLFRNLTKISTDENKAI